MPRQRKREDTDLSRFLDAALKQRGISQNEFARLIGWKPNSLVDLKLRCETPEMRIPNRQMVDHWAQVLGLNEWQADYFFDLIQLAHAPTYVQNLVARLRPLKHGRRVAESPLDYRLPD